MTSSWQRRLLLFSLALNAAFVALAAVRLGTEARHPVEQARRGMAPGRALLADWPARRADMLEHLLQLDPAQRRQLEALGPLGPPLREMRRGAFAERQTFERALAAGDVDAARAAAKRISDAQARLDSLTAEAMLREIELLRPEQRQRYLRLTFRQGPLRRMRHGMPPGLGIGWAFPHVPSGAPSPEGTAGAPER